MLFNKPINDNIDTIQFKSVQQNSVNLSLHIQYTFAQKYDLGFNIDMVGFSFGRQTQGEYQAPNSAEHLTSQSATPTPFNVLLIANNDRGMLNSELFFRYWFSATWAVKIGGAHLFTEFTSEEELRLGNDRWRLISNLFVVGISLKPF